MILGSSSGSGSSGRAFTVITKVCWIGTVPSVAVTVALYVPATGDAHLIAPEIGLIVRFDSGVVSME